MLTNAAAKDRVYVYNPASGYTTYTAGKNGTFPAGNPNVPNVGEGFFYENNSTTPLTWTENFSVSNP
jgi:hypothetical protein